MWKNLKIKNVSGINKLISEYEVWMVGILPDAKMKIRVYEEQNGSFFGITNIQLKRKFDGGPEAAVGFGDNSDSALENTIRYFNSMLEEDYSDYEKEGISRDNLDYSVWSDF